MMVGWMLGMQVGFWAICGRRRSRQVVAMTKAGEEGYILMGWLREGSLGCVYKVAGSCM